MMSRVGFVDEEKKIIGRYWNKQRCFVIFVKLLFLFEIKGTELKCIVHYTCCPIPVMALFFGGDILNVPLCRVLWNN